MTAKRKDKSTIFIAIGVENLRNWRRKAVLKEPYNPILNRIKKQNP